MQQTSYRILRLTCATTALLISMLASAQRADTSWQQDFRVPPESALPRTWWHWTASNITKEGITKDLEWMKRSGIGGMQLSDVAAGSGQTVDKKIPFWSPEWFDAVKFSASEASRLGLEMSMFSSAGWSLTGGPWVKPEEAMKKLVWAETTIDGGKSWSGKLPKPPDVEGPMQNIPRGRGAAGPGFYKDFAVIAYPAPADETAIEKVKAKISINEGSINAALLSDGDLVSPVYVVPSSKTNTAWLLYEYDQPVKAKAIMIAAPGGIPYGRIMASEDGIKYKLLAALPGKQGYRPLGVRTFAFPEMAARFFKIELTGTAPKPGEIISQVTTPPDSAYKISEVKIFTGARVHRWEDKAGFNFMFEYEAVSTPDVPAASAINPATIIDLTSKMSEDGTLTWKAPAGKWTIMRFGYSLTGAKNRPAVPSGLGYECDKLSRKHTESYLRGYTGPLMKALDTLYGKSLRYIMMDSWEAGIQNWTDEMPAEFKQRRGYSLLPFLPVLAGKVVQNAETSDRLLWDFRRTLVDMFAENHYGTVTRFLNKQGLKTYSEAGGVSLESIEDALLNKKYVDIPMGEFWVKDLHPSSMYYEDVRGAASASHIYGKGLVAAEAFTGGNFESPYTLKKISDYWFTQGINRLVFHTSAHQPLDTKPGNAMVGTHINRNITWAELAKPFVTYLSRNSYMLQKGLYVADIAYLLNEGAPSTMPFWGAGLQPSRPEGYESDYINADALISRMKVDDRGRLVMPDGMSYSMLVLPLTDRMTLPVLRKIRELVSGGATIVGPKPVQTPGLTAYPSSDDELTAIAGEIWGDLEGVSRTMRQYGKGHVYWGMPLDYVLSEIKVQPDIEFSRPLNSNFSWIHRRDGDKDIFFIVNRTDTVQDFNVSLRVQGKDPELWHSDNGQTEPASYSMQNNRTVVPLHLNERESVFIVLARKTTLPARTVPAPVYSTLATIAGAWDVHFPPKMGAPDKIEMQVPGSWNNSADEGVKYFSGTAVFNKTFEVPKNAIKPGQKVLLDLGRVGDIAEVYLNGVKLDTLWKAPFRADITQQVKTGSNKLEIRVTNEWSNRLVGDAQADADKKVLSSYIRPFGGGYVLTPSGLLGNVKLMTVEPGKLPE